MALIVFAICVTVFCIWLQNHGFSPWVKRAELGKWMEDDSAGKSYYVQAVEGRMRNGEEEYRVRLTPSPQGVEWYWYWWYAMDYDYYKMRLDRLNGDGFDCIWSQSYMHSDGKPKYQAVFLKIIRNPN
ncbi:MAG: hypothetical protein HC904_16495 [Blastochloris sp.]|nr:hypothetical protein [Blastochloris sp.]